MFKRKILLVVALVVALVLVTAVAYASGEAKATGGGVAHTSGGDLYFGFSASRPSADPESATGKFVFVWGQGNNRHVTVDCLDVVDGEYGKWLI